MAACQLLAAGPSDTGVVASIPSDQNADALLMSFMDQAVLDNRSMLQILHWFC